MAKANRRPLAVFNVKNYRRIAVFILKIRTIILNIGNHAAIFVTPAPALATVTTDVNNLETAEAVAETRVTGAVTARNLQYQEVLDDVFGLLYYVQILADNAPDEETAINIIISSGFDLKVNGVRAKDTLAVKNGPTSGSVKLVAKAAAKRASYNWQQSLNNGATWTELPPTLQAKTIVNGLNPAAKVFFRVRPVFKDGPGNWSQSVSIIVQ